MPEPERGPAHELAPGRAVADRVAQVAPADDQQGQRHQPADLADAPRDGDPDRAHDRAAELEPDRGRRDHGQREHQQADAVAAVLRSRSRAPRPIPRATAPMPCAIASQIAATPLKTPSKSRATGPLPVRTARGAGRRLRVAPRAAGRLVDFFFDEVLLRLRVLRAREVEEPPLDVLLLRDARRGRRTGRHATTLGNRHTSHTHHTNACRPQISHGSRGLRGVRRCLGCAQVIGRSRGESLGGSGRRLVKIFPRRRKTREIPQAGRLPCADRGRPRRSSAVPGRGLGADRRRPAQAAKAPSDLVAQIRNGAKGSVTAQTFAATGASGMIRAGLNGDLLPSVAGDSKAAAPPSPTRSSPSTARRSARVRAS